MPCLTTYGVFAVGILIASARALSTTCYWPNGNKSTPAGYYLPCNLDSDDTFSTCCAAKDECTTNGLCKSLDDASDNAYWRNACSDPTWKSPNCINHCLVNPDTGTLDDNSWQVWACTQTTYCCAPAGYSPSYTSNYSCCDTPGAVFDIGPAVFLSGKIFATTQFPATATSSTTSSATPSATSTMTEATISTTPSAISSNNSQHGLSAGAAAGIGVSVAVIAVILAAVAWFMMRIRNQRKNALKDSLDPNNTVNRHLIMVDDTAEKPSTHGMVHVSEADTDWRGHELQALRPNTPIELAND